MPAPVDARFTEGLGDADLVEARTLLARIPQAHGA